MTRAENYARILSRTSAWDMIVIGGGATGAGIAVDAASGGMTCCCWSRAILARAPPAAAPSWSTAACAISSRATSRW